MEVSVHRCCLSRTLLYSVIFSSLLAWTLSFSRPQHDGRTVTLMLAKLGEGPLLLDRDQGRNRSSVTMDGAETDCEQEEEGEESCSGRRTVNLSSLEATGSVAQSLCWGYEKDCDKKNRLFIPHCHEPYKPWARDLEGKHEEFWRQGDFGYVKKEVDSMMSLCKPQAKGDSKLECSRHLRHCRARHLYMDFRRFKEMSKMEGRYKNFLEDIFEEGEVGGRCQFNAEVHRGQGEHKSPLQSWFAELGPYSALNFKPTSSEHCDEIITKPTVFIKLDAGVNLYHHYCDFFNLYASQHINGSFSDDIYIVNWDTSYRPYIDLFGETWKAFSRHPVKRLSDFEGKRMCFSDAVFPLLARMRHGLYYNTYLLPGCYGSGLMQAFSKHLLARLGIYQEDSDPQRVRVTLLSRSTRHRRIVNEEELVRAMKTVGFFDVRVVDYKARVYPFLDQLQTSHNSDIFLGMHGSGLTHLIFLPDWAAAFEIYNTEDPRCYHDLARLRGVQYITWEDENKVWPEAEGKHPTLGTHHAKFTNYSFDVNEFMRLMVKLGQDVQERKMAAAHSLELSAEDTTGSSDRARHHEEL